MPVLYHDRRQPRNPSDVYPPVNPVQPTIRQDLSYKTVTRRRRPDFNMLCCVCICMPVTSQRHERNDAASQASRRCRRLIELLVRVELDARVARRVLRVYCARRRVAVRVLEEHHVALVLDELALLVHPVHLCPSDGVPVERDAG